MPLVYGDMASGNCYKIALLFSRLGIEHEWQGTLVVHGETRTEEFRALNPAGQIPVVVLEDGTVLTQSNAILYYFARNTDLVPADPLLMTRMLEWQFFEQYSHEPTIAVRRFIQKFLQMPADRRAEYAQLEEGGYRALGVLERCLAENDFLVGSAYSLADISLYAYTHVADEGGFDLSSFPAINGWLDRVQGEPGYIGMNSR
ncbi:glutathione S-transferase [Chromatiales bacterium (ex Bugula neritina AB1)]|nr:glutathione S-transferase [Chromatiales bacterium (ex Bugula neritina AB1)]